MFEMKKNMLLILLSFVLLSFPSKTLNSCFGGGDDDPPPKDTFTFYLKCYGTGSIELHYQFIQYAWNWYYGGHYVSSSKEGTFYAGAYKTVEFTKVPEDDRIAMNNLDHIAYKLRIWKEGDYHFCSWDEISQRWLDQHSGDNYFIKLLWQNCC